MGLMDTLKWTLQIIASIISAVLTALGTTSCMGIQ
ncbi:MAG: smalltalk protein [Prevotella sp.]|nr:smalltalk protein [Prevotella sp.]